jgi:hypothetical protein
MGIWRSRLVLGVIQIHRHDPAGPKIARKRAGSETGARVSSRLRTRRGSRLVSNHKPEGGIIYMLLVTESQPAFRSAFTS